MPEVERWRDGQPVVETEDDRAWLRYLASLRENAIPFQRVRVLTEPLTEYLRWMFQAIGSNVAAGEDVRWLPDHVAHDLRLPDYDFYIIDDQRVAVLRFSVEKELLGIEVDDDPYHLVEHQAWRDVAWPLAIPHANYRNVSP
jgi:hypothetical protein